MGDQGMDPCECLWGHELAMRRLLNLLRNSQSYCTDTECFRDGMPRPETTDNGTDNGLLMSLFIVGAMLLYFFSARPQMMARGPSKPSKSGNDPNGAPPSPPPAMS